jgi:NifC-like ABC-type porter
MSKLRRRRAVEPRQPVVLIAPATVAVVLLAVPLIGIVVRAPWDGLVERLTAPEVRQALALSLAVSGWALVLSLALGIPLAWLLARTRVPGKAVIRSLILLPMVLPPTVAGVALLQGFGRSGVFGGVLETFGISLPFTTAAAVLAATFVSMPFLVVTLEGALAGMDVHFEEAAATMGAGPLQTLRFVTLPLVLPSLIAGAALTWARALGEFGATLTFAGNLPGVTQTLPLQVYLLLQDDPESATAVSLLLLVIAAGVLLMLRGRWLASTGRPARQRRRRVPAGR